MPNTPKTETPVRESFISYNLFIVISIVLLVLAIIFFSFGMYKRHVYRAYQNAYVGGDAYNYIINGTYFTGYMVLSGALLICSTLFFIPGYTAYSDYSKTLETTEKVIEAPSETVEKP